jgi:hypothetical protein
MPTRQPQQRPLASPGGGMIKRSRASLIGGIAVAAGVFALWVALARDYQADGAGMLALGAAVAGAVGLWIWRADL